MISTEEQMGAGTQNQVGRKAQKDKCIKGESEMENIDNGVLSYENTSI